MKNTELVETPGFVQFRKVGNVQEIDTDMSPFLPDKSDLAM